MTAQATVPLGGVHLATTLATLAFLAGDPTVRLAPGRFERATITPDGPGAVAVTWSDGSGAARVTAHGDGAAWLLTRAEGLLGLEDDVDGFAPAARPLRDLWRRHQGDRIPRTATLWHDLAWFVVQQRVRRGDAAAQWRRLVLRFGAPAPGIPELWLPPEPGVVAGLAPYELHALGLEQRRADALRHAARAVIRFARLADGPSEAGLRALGAIRGVGPWTLSCLAGQTWGEADAVVVGDAGIPALVAWVLAGERTADDARMLELLEPYRPHRGRVIRLAFHSRARPPRRGPGLPGVDIRGL